MIKKLLFTLLFTVYFSALFAQGDGIICVSVFNDMNGDGQLNDEETGIEDVGITIVSAPMTFPFALPYSMPTDATGTYCFTGLDNGQYTLAVEIPEGWEIEGSPFFTVDITDSSAPGNYRFGATSTMAAAQFKSTGFALYPNPASSVVTIHTDSTENSEIAIFDIEGKCIMHRKTDGTDTVVDIGRFAPGLYMVKVIAGSTSETLKFIVEK